ncbi:MAG: histidine--tRNA ligase [Candidatus Saccharibacteria bacterium]|nr:histidine--tRNA ligase [Candidatus Saccharibacteria bacterium]
MAKVTARTASGFNEYSPSNQIEFNRLMDIIRGTYEKYGFSPLDTPVLELSEVLLAKGGGETEQQIYRFVHGRNDLTMRYDLTVPLARYVAEHESELVFPFRRYQIGKVYRAERAQAGRFREFYQCDIDVIGSTSPVIDAEFPAIINEIFSQFNFGEFTIRINDRRVLNGFFEGIGLAASSREVLRIIDKMEKITHDELVTELRAAGLSDQQIESVLHFTAIEGSNDEVIAQLRALEASEQLSEGITKLEGLIAALRVMEVPESRFKIDLKIARGLDYYTGTVYETVLNDYPEVGSVCSGGRYDDLASYYTNTSLPGVGISIGLSRLFYKLREAGVINPVSQSPAQVVVMPIEQAQISSSAAIATSLRKAGISTMLYTERDKLNKKMRYADRMGFTYVVLVGEKELQSQSVSIRNMKTAISETVAIAELTQHIAL